MFPRRRFRRGTGNAMPTRTQTLDRLTRLVRQADVTELALQQADLRALDAGRLRAELVSLHRPGRPARIVLSLAGLGVLAGPCLGALAEVGEGLARVGGVLVLCEVPEGTARMLRRTGLARKLPLARSPGHARRLARQGRKSLIRAA